MSSKPPNKTPTKGPAKGAPGKGTTAATPASTPGKDAPEDGTPVERRKALTLVYRRASALHMDSMKKVEEDAKDYNVVFSDKLEKLVFPLGLKMKPMGRSGRAGRSGGAGDANDEPEADAVKARLAGLPGTLGLDQGTTQKYFGAGARTRFFDRYQWLSEQRMKIAATGDHEVTSLYFEQAPNEEALRDSVPFHPVRPVHGGLGGGGSSGSFHSRFKGADSRGASNHQLLLAHSAQRSGVDVIDELDELDELDEQAMIEELAGDEDELLSTQVSARTPTSSRPGTRGAPKTSGSAAAAASAGAHPRTVSTATTGVSSRGSGAGAGAGATKSSRKKIRHDPNGKRLQEDIEKVFKAAEATAATSKDVYSETLLDAMLRPLAASGPAGVATEGAASHTSGARGRSDDFTAATASTVSTLGLFYNSDQLRLSTLRPGEVDFSRGAVTSPRTRYIVGCIQEQLNPRASLLLRKNMTKELNLQHLGMGNQRAKLLADAIKALPFVQSINIADNMLTDDGMGPIIHAAVGIPGLLELNLSQNTIGPVASKALFQYLLSSTCPLERLILNGADVDDFECKNFVDAIKLNRSLRELELSNNKLGMAENLNTVMPDVVTGGEALAELLSSAACNLTKLKLDWNMIRLGGALDLARSLAVNTTLVFLDLSYNSLATEGGVMVGTALLKNRALETLIVANNALDATATFTICAGVIENRTLKRVILDGNPIGIQGMRLLMLIPIIAGNRVKVTAAKCNITIKDPKCWFDFDKLIADYTLHMENGFERAVAFVLLHLIAGHHSFVFSKFVHEAVGRNGAPGKSRNIELVQAVSTEASRFFSSRQQITLEGLMRIQEAASDIRTAVRLFQEVDTDGSGELDRDELMVLMGKMGLHMSQKRLNELMNKYDVDQGGKIELHEFLMLLKSQHKEAAARIKELTEAPIMVLKSDNKTRYTPPETGTLHISVVDGFARKKIYRIMNACDREIISEVTKDVGGISGMNMISSSLQGTKLRLDEALSVADSMLHDNPDRVVVLKKLLVQVNDADDTRNLIQSLLEDNRTDMMRLKRDMGAALRPIMGNPNGYYVLDLAKEMDRLCLEKLLEISMTNAVRRQEASKIAYGRVGDLSQHGNWSSFRNEIFDGKPIVLAPAFAAPMPRYGKLEFDFSGGPRPPKDAVILSDQRIIKTLMMHFLLGQGDYGVALQKLKDMRIASDRTLGCDGTDVQEISLERMRIIGEHVETFYNSLSMRAKQFLDAQEKESSTAVDSNGILIEPFERDKPAFPLTISDHYIRLERQRREEVERLAAQKQLEAEKAAAKAAQASLYGSRPSTGGPQAISHLITLNNRPSSAARPTSANAGAGAGSGAGNGAVGPGAGADVADVADDDTVTTAEGSVHSARSSMELLGGDDDTPHLQHVKSMLALKAAAPAEDDDAAEEEGLNPLDPSHPHNQSTESLEWIKEFELLKQAFKPKSAMETRKVNLKERRHNIGMQENPLGLNGPDDYLEKFQALLVSNQITVGAKAHRVVDMLEDIFARSWILSRHLALILECFVQYGYFKQTKYFGTYRVDLAVALFDRVVDVHNFELVMSVLSATEIACLYCRLGWLNLYNPCKPEGSWELDLGRREERVLAKTLCVLATHEPGDNWTFNTFRWMRTMESMPGWELTQPWLTEDGMPMRGLLNITYYSGEGKRKLGCRPYIAFRKSLLNLVLINEDEIVQEDFRSKPPPLMLPGDRAFHRHQNLWDNYLAPVVDPNRKR